MAGISGLSMSEVMRQIQFQLSATAPASVTWFQSDHANIPSRSDAESSNGNWRVGLRYRNGHHCFGLPCMQMS